MNEPMVIAYGGGTDSTGMIIGLWERQERPDLILFADTLAEKPHTYEFIKTFNVWLEKVGFPTVTVVNNPSNHGSLENHCLHNNSLPSIAYGFKSCSQVFKIRPQEKFMKSWQPALDAWKSGSKVTKCIGFDAGESRRANRKIPDDELKKYNFRFPLIEWGWEREECIEAIERVGLPLPGKSACFFCPSSRPKEIVELYEKYPDLLNRALKIESQADLTTIKGLGRNYAWAEVIKNHQNQMALPFVGFDLPCECTE